MNRLWRPIVILAPYPLVWWGIAAGWLPPAVVGALIWIDNQVETVTAGRSHRRGEEDVG